MFLFSNLSRANRNLSKVDVRFLWFIVFFGLINTSFSLYEDQVGTFDWKQSYVGKVKFASFDTISPTKKLIVGTEENVIAALNLKTGALLWRRVFEYGPEGTIRFLTSVAEGNIISVSGTAPTTVRVWNLATGHIISEWTIAERISEKIEDVTWYVKNGALYHIHPTLNGLIEVTSYDYKTGEKLKHKSISAPFISRDTECTFVNTHYVCLQGDNSLALVFIIDVFKDNATARSLTINTIFGAGSQGPYHLALVPGEIPAFSISVENGQRKRVVMLQGDNNPIPLQTDIEGRVSLYTAIVSNRNILFQTLYNKQVSQIIALDMSSSADVPSLSKTLKIPALVNPAILAMDCPKKFSLCKQLLLSEDHSIALLHDNKLAWSREEALANIVAVEIVELPISDRDQAIETEFDQNERDVFGMLLRRLSSQANQVKSVLQYVLGLTPPPSNQRADLVRDKFGLHKMIVIVTSAGKMYGIETREGEIIWQLRVPGGKDFLDSIDKMILYVQRGSQHFPNPPQCALLMIDKISGHGSIFTFNPITGQALGSLEKLNYKVKQSMLLHATSETYLRSIAILDNQNVIHVFPENTKAIASQVGKNTYFFTIDRKTGIITGLSLAYSTSEKLIANKVWELVLWPRNQRITEVVFKNPIERVQSQGRVLGDRSVLYKYINPNLVVIVTEGVNGAHKSTLNIYLLDVVSGSMIFSTVHKKARGPVHVVHSENWIVYSYFNERSRRNEIATLELYEGQTQSNSTVFSSIANTKLPVVERQAFIFPAVIQSMRETITEKGITSKHIIIALANGGILELPWMLVDPRRPINPELREEGLIPYMPEIPIHMDSIINYNQSVAKVSGIYTSPSGLESTCLVFVHGLDLFYTRVAPSKTFDVLKENFDYYLIVIVLLALLISSYVSKKLASQKIQKQAWK